MSKWFGKIGYSEVVEVIPGVWEEQITEREYFGDVYKISRKLQSASQVNDNIDVSNEISIVADPFARDNFSSIRYIEFMGTKWKVSNVEVVYPRLNLRIGGLYNENET